MHLYVEVTQADIDQAREWSETRLRSCWCPVALALRRARALPVWVEREDVRFGLAGTDPKADSAAWFAGQPRLPLPIEARQFIELFDGEHAVEPFAFVLNIPEDEE